MRINKSKLRVKEERGLSLRPKELTVGIQMEPLDVLAYLIGRQALFGEMPYQTFANWKLRESARLLECWAKTGYIIGHPTSWTLSAASTAQIQSRLQVQLKTLAPKKTVELYDLVREYRFLLKQHQKRTGARPRTMGTVAAFFRRLCRLYPSDFIAAALPKFFASTGWSEFSLENFEKLLSATYHQ